MFSSHRMPAARTAATPWTARGCMSTSPEPQNVTRWLVAPRRATTSARYSTIRERAAENTSSDMSPWCGVRSRGQKLQSALQRLVSSMSNIGHASCPPSSNIIAVTRPTTTKARIR